MLDPRIYRTGLIVVVLALLVLAFSLGNQQSALPNPLAPDAFNGQNAYTTMTQLASAYPDRPPGSASDNDIAQIVHTTLGNYAFAPTTNIYSARTADGTQSLENVVGVRPGTESGSVVIVAARDARGSPAMAQLSGTATLLELARVLQGETLHRTVVLASISGSQGMAGAIRLAQTVGGPVDAVLVLGDLASSHLHQPVIVPWSQGPQVAPPMLRNTVSAQLSQQAAIGSGGTSLFGQYAHLAFPLTLTAQGAFDVEGIPAVTLTLSGERGPAPDATVAGPDQLNTLGRTVLSTVTALDAGPSVPAPSAYVIFDHKVVPGWAISMFVLALIVPVALATIDGLARARRRGYPIWRWLVAILLGAVPAALVVAVVLAARLAGALDITPPGPVATGAIPMHSAGAIVLVLAAVVGIAALALIVPVALRFAAGPRRSRDPEGAIGGATVAMLAMMCAVTVVVWLSNPYAALLLIPALHLWLPALSPELRLPSPVRIAIVALGVVPIALLVLYYATILGFGPIATAWSAALLIAGHVVSPLVALEWCVFVGCALTAGGLVIGLARQPRPEQLPVTVRGPVTYAGPGSLGGTKSAIRR